MKAIVCGAGIAGLASACFLARKGWSVTVVEKASAPRAAGYMVDFFASGFDAAEKAGLLPALREKAHHITGVDYLDRDGHMSSRIDYAAFAASLEGRILSLMRGDLESVLRDALPEGVTVRYGTTVDAVEEENDAVRVSLSDATTLEADLLVGADGIHSRVRALVFGPEERFLRFLGFHTAAFVFEDRALAERIGESFSMLSVPRRQVGLYAVDEGRVAAFFAHAAERAERPADPAGTLARIYGDLGWEVPRMLAALKTTDDLYYDVVAQVEMERWHTGRTVLVGDAGFAVSLLAGQGASLAVGSSYVLAEAVGEGHVIAGLERLEAQMGAEVKAKQAGGRKAAKWFVPPTRAHLWVRTAFLNLARKPGLKNLLRWFFSPSLKSSVR